MTTTEEGLSIYGEAAFDDMDVGSVMRWGHPDVVAGDAYITGLVRRLRETMRRGLVVLDVGSGSGDLSARLAQALGDGEVVAIEPAPGPAAQAQAKLERHPNARVFAQRFEDWTDPADVVISWGTHHHLRHDYLEHAAALLGENGLLVIGDEFCPEYLTPEDEARLGATAEIAVVDGYVFDSVAALADYRASGVPPEWSVRLEERRRRALWTWYRFVCDYAVERAAWDVVVAELAIAHHDLVTADAGEHKTSPKLLERELALAGFRIMERRVLGRRPPELTSFVVYTCSVARGDCTGGG